MIRSIDHFIFVSEILYRLYDTSSPSGEVHAERTEQRKVQNLENSGIDAIRIFYHGSHRIKHSTAHDEGKRQRFARLSPLLSFSPKYVFEEK